ncbi:MAG: cation diffusion facilitator family transporter [Eubacteriales bacterium]|nr:cation diffusion facilitator family transporter [Eubacteriales bacterium]
MSTEQTKTMDPAAREKVIVRASAVGILTNVVLAAFKAFVGLASNSIAITLDAVNNLSDAMSSVITIIGAKLAGKAPDKKHPFGYGRVEYMSSLIVAAIVLYAGITSLIESVKKIIHPEVSDYSLLTLIIIAVAILVKLALGRYVKNKGNEVNSGSLIASGSDASFDAILSASVLASAILYLATRISLEAIVGAVIAVIIIKSGIEMIGEAVSSMLGERVGCDLARNIKATVAEDPDVLGAYDLFLNDYGPDRYMGSIHVEVPDTMTAVEIDAMSRRIFKSVYSKYGVAITAVGIYSHNTGDDEASKMLADIRRKVMAHDGVLQMHGFYVDFEAKTITFDTVLEFKNGEGQTAEEVYAQILDEIQKAYPDYNVHVTCDRDMSE